MENNFNKIKIYIAAVHFSSSFQNVKFGIRHWAAQSRAIDLMRFYTYNTSTGGCGEVYFTTSSVLNADSCVRVVVGRVYELVGRVCVSVGCVCVLVGCVCELAGRVRVLEGCIRDAVGSVRHLEDSVCELDGTARITFVQGSTFTVQISKSNIQHLKFTI